MVLCVVGCISSAEVGVGITYKTMENYYHRESSVSVAEMADII